MSWPTLVVISGPPGTGKTTLAHALASAIGCPAISRDEIKEGMVHAVPGYVPQSGDALTQQASRTFFAVLDLLLSNGVNLVAEAAFQDAVWRPELERFIGRASLRIIQCCVAPEVAHARFRRRTQEPSAARAAHADASLLAALDSGENPTASFVPISLRVPVLKVDTSDGYRPGLAEMVAFSSTASAMPRSD